MTATLEQLEEKIAYLERANNELSDMVYRQARELDSLRVRLSGVVTRIEAAQAEPAPFVPENEKPPHY
jgi:SlyX protein